MAPFTIFSFFIFILFSNNAANALIPKFSTILIFGDSLLDTGNNNFIPTPLQANHYPYGVSFPGGKATGRFSDGKLMSDFMAEALAIKDTVPPFLDPNLSPYDLRTGVCFASAGSGYDDLTATKSFVIPVTKQYGIYFKRYKRRLIEYFGEKETRDILNNSFVFATSGSNDMALNFYVADPRTLLRYTISDYQDHLLNKIEAFVKSLYRDGCRKMAIAGLPPICGALESGGLIGCLNSRNSDPQVFNRKLVARLASLQSSLPGSRLVYADIFTPLKQMATSPLTHGIWIPFGACCGEVLPTIGLICSAITPRCINPSHYFFWDSIHPTQTVYRYMSKFLARNLLPQFLHT